MDKKQNRLLDCTDESHSDRDLEIAGITRSTDHVRAPLWMKRNGPVLNWKITAKQSRRPSPVIEERNEKDWYVTIPMGTIMADTIIITVCVWKKRRY